MKIFNRLLTYLKYAKRPFIIGLFYLLLTTGIGIITPIIVQQVIDQVITPADELGQVIRPLLIQFLGTILVLAVAQALLEYYGQLFRLRSANQIIRIMRNQLFDKIQSLPIAYFDSLPGGKIAARITNDTENLRQQFYTSVLGNMLQNILTIIGIFIAIFIFSRPLAYLILALTPIILLWYFIYSKYALKFSRKDRELNSIISGQMTESISGMEIIQTYQQEEMMADHLCANLDNWLGYMKKYVNLDATLQWPFASFLENSVAVFVLSVISYQFLNDRLVISVGVIYLYIDYVTRFFSPISNLIQQIAFLQQALAAGERVFEVLDMDDEPDSEKVIAIDQGQVEFKQVSFGYKENHAVLKRINLTAKPGETIAFVGHTGSGKTSLMNLLMRFYEPDDGAIYIDGQNIQDFSKESLRQQMGIVLQDPYLFTGTLYENISLGNPDITRKIAEEALREVGAANLLEKFAGGIDYQLTRRGKQLSAGERQLISFARALAAQPKILILDEATSSIDTETEEVIQKAMNRLKRGSTTFMIAHRLSTVQDADHIIVLDHGRIIEEGSHEELIKANGTYAKMLNLQKHPNPKLFFV